MRLFRYCYTRCSTVSLFDCLFVFVLASSARKWKWLSYALQSVNFGIFLVLKKLFDLFFWHFAFYRRHKNILCVVQCCFCFPVLRIIRKRLLFRHVFVSYSFVFGFGCVFAVLDLLVSLIRFVFLTSTNAILMHDLLLIEKLLLVFAQNFQDINIY